MKFPRYSAYKDSGVPWLGEVPAHWGVRSLKRLVALQSGDAITSDQIEPSGSFPVFGGNGVRGYTSEPTHTGEHVLIGRQGALCGNINYASGSFWASEHAIVVTPRENTATLWLGELLRAMNFNQYSQAAAQPGLSVDMLSALKVPVPPHFEQESIAAFLSCETAKLDSLVAEQKTLLKLVAEKRAATIAHVVTRGLNPHATMKESGVDWLGEVPAHWEVRTSRRLLQEVDELSTTGEEELLSVSHLTGVTKRSEKSVNMFEAEDKTGYKIVRPGQLVINTMWAWMGAMGIAVDDGIVSPAYNVYKCRDGGIIPEYVGQLVKSDALVKEITRFSKGVWSSRLRLYPEELFQIALPVPPEAEQKAIVAHLRTMTSRHASLAREAESSITLLRERRAALISAAVTGRVDVLEVASASRDARAAA